MVQAILFLCVLPRFVNNYRLYLDKMWKKNLLVY